MPEALIAKKQNTLGGTGILPVLEYSKGYGIYTFWSFSMGQVFSVNFKFFHRLEACATSRVCPCHPIFRIN